MMEKRTLLIVGLIGGILVTVGVFLPWVSATAYGITVSASGWDALSASVSNNPDVLLILIGGILALIGGLLAVLAVKMKSIAYLIPLGGILAIIGWIWSATSITDWSVVSYGFYACLVGAILALIGSMGLRGK